MCRASADHRWLSVTTACATFLRDATDACCSCARRTCSVTFGGSGGGDIGSSPSANSLDAPAKAERDGLVALTFDDGLVDNLTIVAPLLKSVGVPATVFVVSGWLGLRHPDAPWTRAMSAPELRALSEAGFEIGGHSAHHDDLTRFPRDRAILDMSNCRAALESVLDRPVEIFAYPFGERHPPPCPPARRRDIHAACRSSGAGSWDEPFNLPRQSMVNGASTIGLLLKREDRYEPLMRTLAGRATRRAARFARSIVR